MSKTAYLMMENIRSRREWLKLHAPTCECPLNKWAKRSAFLVEAVKPAQWQCEVCRRTWIEEPK